MDKVRADRARRDAPAKRAAAATQPVVQAKLRVGAADDPAEREADRIAAEVSRWIERGSPAGTAESESAPASDVEREPIAQRVRRMAAPMGLAGGEVDSELEGQIARARRSGSPLPDSAREEMDQGFGADFSRVRVHTDDAADTLNRSLGARAFTLGNDVFFAKGEFQPGSSDGRRLIAHELTHTLQQDGQQDGASASRKVRRAESESNETESNENENEAANEAANSNETESESESNEVEGEEPEGVQLTGRISAGEFEAPEIESTEAPGNMEADMVDAARSPEDRARAERRERAADAETYTVRLGDVGLNTTTKKVSTMPAGDLDASVVVNAQTTGSTKGGGTPTPFGALSRGWRVFVPSYTVAKKDKERIVTINATFDQSTQWGTNDGGRIDIASGTSPHVTADNYHEISDDLTPLPKELSWVAPRRKYWSKAICERHEQFHASDVRQWGDTQGKEFVNEYLRNKSITIRRRDLRKRPEVVQDQITAAVADARDALNQANTVYMRGVGNTYYSYPGEERAFGDGKVPYEKLAAAVRKQGRALAKARRQAKREERNAKKAGTSGTPTPSGSTTPETV